MHVFKFLVISLLMIHVRQMFSAKSGLIIVEAILSCLPSAPYVWSTKKYFQPVKVACGVILYLEVLHYKCYP